MTTTMADLKALAGEEEQSATLKKLPRKELQALAKAHGINATQKNATLINELVRLANKPPKSRSPFLNKDKPEDIVLIEAVDDKFVEENGCKSWEEWESEVMVEEFVNESDEDVWFTKGVAVVTPIDENGTRGPSTTIKAGDFAVIPGSDTLIWEWDITEPVHKHYREHE